MARSMQNYWLAYDWYEGWRQLEYDNMIITRPVLPGQKAPEFGRENGKFSEELGQMRMRLNKRDQIRVKVYGKDADHRLLADWVSPCKKFRLAYFNGNGETSHHYFHSEKEIWAQLRLLHLQDTTDMVVHFDEPNGQRVVSIEIVQRPHLKDSVELHF